MSDDLEIIKHALETADLFLDWEPLMIELVASIAYRKSYERGDQIFDENTESKEMYIIESGSVEIRVRPGLIGKPNADTASLYQTIATLRVGQNFGEVSLIDEGRRSAAAICTEATRLIIIPRDQIIKICENVPRLGYHLMRSLAIDLALKIRNTDLEMRAHLTWTPNPRA